VPITKRSTGSSAGTPNVVQKDYQRLRFLLNDGQQHESLIPDVILDDAAGQIYTAEIAVGDPSTQCEFYLMYYIYIISQVPSTSIP
jgi:hypothetical protein